MRYITCEKGGLMILINGSKLNDAVRRLTSSYKSQIFTLYPKISHKNALYIDTRKVTNIRLISLIIVFFSLPKYDFLYHIKAKHR